MNSNCFGFLRLVPILMLGIVPGPVRAQPDEPSSVLIGTPDPAFTGHYYLSGVRETGSELLLGADGRFEWFMSYGAVDQFAKGQWGRKGDRVTLVSDQPGAGDALFRADTQVPWNNAAEVRLRDTEYDKQVQDAEERCPLLQSRDAVMTPGPIRKDDTPDPAAAARAVAALDAARAARAGAQDAAARAFVGPLPDSAVMAEAGAALERWREAEAEMVQAYDEARLPVPDLPEPVLPAQCRYPVRPADGEIAQDRWQRGIAVVVGDPARELRLSDVLVEFSYADGHGETATTNSGGWAFAPLRPGHKVTSIRLSLAEPVSRSMTLSISPLAEGIQPVLVNVDQITGPPFERLRLKVDQGDLVPMDTDRGRYSRH